MIQDINHYDTNTQIIINIAYVVLYFLRKYQRSDKIFANYEHDDIVINDTSQQHAQNNNIILSFL